MAKLERLQLEGELVPKLPMAMALRGASVRALARLSGIGSKCATRIISDCKSAPEIQRLIDGEIGQACHDLSNLPDLGGKRSGSGVAGAGQGDDDDGDE